MTMIRDSSQRELDAWPNGRNPNQLDPGPPVPGFNCHIVIDGVGYVYANTPDFQQESRQGIGIESTAPFFGDPQNIMDTQSSDLTMLLPIGQSDFSDGIGSLKLETDPKGYEACNNLQLTPQGTLLNGPLINKESMPQASPDIVSWWQEGYYATMVNNTTPWDYFSIGNYLYVRQAGVWNLILTNPGKITHLYGYAGQMLASGGDGNSNIYLGTTGYPVMFRPFKGFTVNGNPFICYKDGRTYSAFLASPPAISNVTDETSAGTNYASYSYGVQYFIDGGTVGTLVTRMGDLFFYDKLQNMEVVIGTIPTRGYHGGRVYRRLYRSKNNDSTTMYVLADWNVLFDERIGWVDQQFDDTKLTLPYDWTTINNTAMTILRIGDVNHNMANPDVSPIWYPEPSQPNTGDFVWQAQTFHDTSGNEGAIFGTTSGLFAWDGASSTITTLRPQNYNFFNCFSLAVNHGQVYFTLARTQAKAWSSSQEAFINGPWYSQYTSIDDIRLMSAGEYVFFGVTGYTKYNPSNITVSIYRYDGKVFDWMEASVYSGAAGNGIRPILGALGSEHSFIWFNNNSETNQNIITLDPKYISKQTTAVNFKSAMSDCGLPRLRKQVFAVMVRYLQLTPQPQTYIMTANNVGDAGVWVQNGSIFQVGDWVAIDDPSPTNQEYRKISSIVNGGASGWILGMTHPLGRQLQFSHAAGTNVYRCGAVAKLRNVFNDNLTTQDIEIGGPYRSDYLFSYIHLPSPVYTFLDGLEIDWRDGTVMELVGWSILTALNPPYYGKMDISLRLQDYVKLPNSLFDNATALQRRTNLEDAFNKGSVQVVDQFNQARPMRVQKLAFDYEEPKQRHSDTKRNQATAHVSLLDNNAELMKQESLVIGIPTNQ